MNVRSNQGDTVDFICWRQYGRTIGVVERVLNANPGLAEMGEILPIGTLIELPNIIENMQQNQMVKLWD
jgi:phage tail protein X